ncbi:MAG: hypothetical protein AB7Q17_18160 [Phycisphaerae bacterium]
MADFEPATERSGLNKARFIGAALEIVSYIFVLSGLAWAGHIFWLQSQAEQPSTAVFLSTAAVLLGVFASGLVLWAIAEMLRKLDLLHVGLEHTMEILSVRGTSVPGAEGGEGRPIFGADGRLLGELLSTMREVRDISLLNESERKLRLELQGQETAKRLQEQVPAMLREHKWAEAWRQVREARQRFPSFMQWEALERQIEQVRSQVESRDVDNASRQIDDLIALGAWDRVIEVVQDVVQRHPQAPRAQELAQRVNREREKLEAEQRARLMAQAQEAAKHRDWTAAFQAVTTMMQRYPGSPEAEKLRIDLPMLRENMEIQTRKRMEAKYTECLRTGQYAQALEVARDLVSRYPGSPQAAKLRDQLPKLIERVHGEA